LITTATTHEDIAVVRACVLVLDALCSHKETAMLLMQQYAIYKVLGGMRTHSGCWSETMRSD